MLSEFLRILKLSLIIIKAQGIQISLIKDRLLKTIESRILDILEKNNYY